MSRFPACNETRGTILPICRNICDFVDMVVSQCISQQFLNNPEFPAVNRLLDTFECLEPQSYYNFPAQYIETDPNICSGFCEYAYAAMHMYIHNLCSGQKIGIELNNQHQTLTLN